MKETLREFGLSEKEAKVYLALISLGASRATALAKKSGIKRSTVYIMLDELIERGLVMVAEKRGVKIYNPASPQQLVKYLKATAEKYQRLAQKAKKLAPQLKLKGEKTITKPKVQLYEGSEGLRSVYEDTLSSLEGIRRQAIKKSGVQINPATKEDFGHIPEIMIQGNKIILVSPKEKFAAVVESEELAKKLEKLFRASQKGEDASLRIKRSTKGI